MEEVATFENDCCFEAPVELALPHLKMIVVLRHLLELVLLHLKMLVVLRRLLELILLLLRHLKRRLCDVSRLAEGIYRRTQVPRTIVEGTTARCHGLKHRSQPLHLVGAVTSVLVERGREHGSAEHGDRPVAVTRRGGGCVNSRWQLIVVHL